MDNLIREKSHDAPRLRPDNLPREKTLFQHLRDFILWCKVSSYSKATIQGYTENIGTFCDFVQARFGIDKLSQLERCHIQEYVLECMARDIKPVSVFDYYRAVRRWLNWLKDNNIIEFSPAEGIKAPRVPRTIIQTFRPDHIADMLTLCPDNTFLGARNRAIIMMFLDTGLRLSEMANIRIADINFEQETIRVMGKGGKERVVRFGKKTQKAVLRYQMHRNDDIPQLWLSEERRTVLSNGIQNMIYKIGKQAELKDVRCSCHTFRHTFAINYLRNGGDVFTLQYLLGHSSLEMTQRYVSSLRSEDAIRVHRKFSPVDNMRF